MLRVLFLIYTALLVTQTSIAQKVTLKKMLSLQMPEGDGTRGAAVVWHPTQKKYYASFAGNAVYPMAVFDVRGKRISADTLETQVDTRGLWFNSKTQSIQGNAYSSAGWFTYTLNKTGIPVKLKFLVEEMMQPNDQASGVYNPKTNEVCFFTDEGEVKIYDPTTFQEKRSLALKIKKEGEIFDLYYITCAVNAAGQIALYDYLAKEIDLFNLSTGEFVKTLSLPEEAQIADNFSFAYSNGMYWLFDDQTRTWNGYK